MNQKKELVGLLEMRQAIPFHVAYATSEDPLRPASNLELPHAKHRGWQSEPCAASFNDLFLSFFSPIHTNPHRFGTFPQHVVLQLDGGPYQINLLQILCHEFKIPTSVDIYIGMLADPSKPYSESNATYSHLGYVNSSLRLSYLRPSFLFKNNTFLR